MLRVDEPARHRVLVVDDEPHIADALTVALRHVGYDARAVYDGTSALESAQAWSPDLLLLDVMLPDMSGYDVCRQLVLTGGGAGVVFLSARDEVSDRIRGFGVGADDYVAKPFSLEEVLARVRAVLLRRERGRAPRAEESVLRYQDLELDDDKHLVTRAGVPIELSPTEYTLLRFLLQNAERVMSKEQILGHVWHYEFRGNGNVVETFVSTLRKKLAMAGPNLIQTVRGFGYVLRADRR
jgi:two-component system, OmpR family, response regulator